MLDVLSRSQRGRMCEYRRGTECLQTPAVLQVGVAGTFGLTVSPAGRILRLFGAEITVDAPLLTSASSGIQSQPRIKDGIAVLRLPLNGTELIPADTEVVVIPNAFELRDDFRRLVDQVIKARTVAGYGRLLCLLGIAEPANAALLAYMGVDLIDDSFCLAAGINGIGLIPEAKLRTGKNESAANTAELLRETDKISTFIAAGRLRELVDQRAPSSPYSVAALRVFDDVGYDYQEEECAVDGGRFACNTTQALRRPDVRRYQQMIGERYRKPANKRILLLLPCSAKKPYHTSKTHKLFASAIHTAPHDTLVHEVIVTSPLGIVPRELDAFYPANAYDIPVTGQWKPEEINTIRMMLAQLLAKNHYDRVICHLGEDAELVRGLCDMTETVIGDPVSPASLANLDRVLREAATGMDPVDYGVDRSETVRSALGFQFGRDVADAIMDEHTYAIGKYPYWKVLREDPQDRSKRTQLAMLSAERGMFSLTQDGAEILAAMGKNIVEMTPFELKGSLFAVGVAKADHLLRIGDEAVIVCNGRVTGVGVAAMSGLEMEQLHRGVAVKVRHKF
ncbi:MAG: DUF5591 domain-containing protein [Candidatus Methanomethylophilus sp.]|nr:DUF5591 domain-containing protein [Methanomethylophilus sp.]